MKVMKRIIGMALIFTLMTCGTAFAGLKDVRNSLLNTYTQSRLLADTCVSDGDITPNSARGRVFSAGMLELVNKQDGTLHISVDTFAHSVVYPLFFWICGMNQKKSGYRLDIGNLKKLLKKMRT